MGLLADAEESTGDTDSDGIPDYLEDNIKRSKTRTVMAYPTPRTPMLTATAFQTHRRALAMPTVTASPTTSTPTRTATASLTLQRAPATRTVTAFQTPSTPTRAMTGSPTPRRAREARPLARPLRRARQPIVAALCHTLWRCFTPT